MKVALQIFDVLARVKYRDWEFRTGIEPSLNPQRKTRN